MIDNPPSKISTVFLLLLTLWIPNCPSGFASSKAIDFDQQRVGHFMQLCTATRGAEEALVQIEKEYWDQDIVDFEGVTGNKFILRTRNKFGVIAFKNNRVVIAFPGTNFATPADVITNLKTAQTKLSNHPRYLHGILDGKKARIHTGLLETYMYCKDRIVKEIREYQTKKSLSKENLRITLTGHSLGGALATAASLDLLQVFFDGDNSKNNLTIVTFGAPKVFNSEVRTHWDEIMGSGNLLRLVDRTDPIPAYPPPVGYLLNFIWDEYKHAGTKRKYQNTRGIKGDVTNHALAHYIQHLSDFYK